MGDLKRKVHDLKSGKPKGQITFVTNGLGADESGNVYKIESMESARQKEIQAYKKRDKRHFTFSHMQYIREITDKLSNKTCGYIFMLQPYIEYKTNTLVTPGRNYRPLDIGDFAEIFGIGRRYVKPILEKLEKEGVIDTETGHYRMNDKYHFRKKAGEDVSMLVKTFSSKVKGLDLKPAEMGVIYKLLPYVHYDTNLICANPFEEYPANVRYLNKTEIAKIVGISRQKIEETLRNLVKAGAVVTVQRKARVVPTCDGDGRDTLVILNPDLISRKRGEHGPLIQQLFAE